MARRHSRPPGRRATQSQKEASQPRAKATIAGADREPAVIYLDGSAVYTVPEEVRAEQLKAGSKALFMTGLLLVVNCPVEIGVLAAIGGYCLLPNRRKR